MVAEEHRSLLGQRLTDSLERRGYDVLTPVQAKVLDPELHDCDLRISSQTGSGKTVAVGLALRELVTAASDIPTQNRLPNALIVVPTRELAKQVHLELSWLFATFGIRLACVTGGSSYRDERRSLAQNPTIVVGTPGRLVDHLNRGALDASALGTIVLDEADRMLDLGFAEDIDAIFAAAPSRSRTHLVSATLGAEVQRLAARFQSNPKTVHGTRPGEIHTDIEHLVHLVPPARRIDALINVLLSQPDERTLVFVRTRVEVASVAQELEDAGFRVAALSGDMEQPARERALYAFRQDKVRVLVATDVAARGIDIQGMTRVIHLEPPTDADSYTHRSGRTGRAGQKGASILFVAPDRQQFARRILEQARIRAKLQPLPDVETLRRNADERTRQSLTDALADFVGEPRSLRIAEELLSHQNPVELVAMLIARTERTAPEPRHLPEIRLPSYKNDRSAQHSGSKRPRFDASRGEFENAHGTRMRSETHRHSAVREPQRPEREERSRTSKFRDSKRLGRDETAPNPHEFRRPDRELKPHGAQKRAVVAPPNNAWPRVEHPQKNVERPTLQGYDLKGAKRLRPMQARGSASIQSGERAQPGPCNGSKASSKIAAHVAKPRAKTPGVAQPHGT